MKNRTERHQIFPESVAILYGSPLFHYPPALIFLLKNYRRHPSCQSISDGVVPVSWRRKLESRNRLWHHPPP